jgi:uncharacterized protein YndB with AHSA1/START domain
VTEVDLSIRIDASPSTVFRYFVDPERMLQWMGVTAEVDPRPGGVYRVDVSGHDVACGTFVEVQPDERVVWSWGWQRSADVPPGSSTVEVTLTPDGDGTVVRLRHTGLPDTEFGAAHSRGWAHYTQRLVIAASGGDPGPDPNRIGSDR